MRKAPEALETAKRNAAAIAIALPLEGAESELVETLARHADAWAARLDSEREQARERGLVAIAALEDAAHLLGQAASVTAWLRSGQSDSRFDRRPSRMLIGAIAPSSRKAYAAELLGETEAAGGALGTAGLDEAAASSRAAAAAS